MLSADGQVVSRLHLQGVGSGFDPWELEIYSFCLPPDGGGSIASVRQKHREGFRGDILALSLGFCRNDSQRAQGEKRYLLVHLYASNATLDCRFCSWGIWMNNFMAYHEAAQYVPMWYRT